MRSAVSAEILEIVAVAAVVAVVDVVTMDVEILTDDSSVVTEMAAMDKGAGDDASSLESLCVAAV